MKDLEEILRALNRIADALEEQNDLSKDASGDIGPQ